MSERQPTTPFDKCRNCPHVGRIARMLARAGGLPEVAEGCEGPVCVSHGEIQTRLVYRGEPSPKKSEFDWNVMTGPAYYSDEPTRYSRTEWTREVVCGREAVEPHEGEVPYSSGELIRVNAEGERIAAFIKGNEDELRDHRGTLAIMALLDATTEMEDAEDAGDAESAQRALDKINQAGFVKPISAGRRGSSTDAKQ